MNFHTFGNLTHPNLEVPKLVWGPKNSRSHFITVRLVEIAIFAYILVNKSTNNKNFEKVLLW